MPARPKPDLGDRIRTARAEKGWKQKHLAAELNVEPITVSRWERGATTPDLDVLRLVADAMQKPVGYFVGDATPAEEGAAGELLRRLDEVVTRLEALADRLESRR